MTEMKNELQKAWDEYQKKAPLTTDSIRDRFNFQHGFNAAFRLFGKSSITKQSSERDEAWFCLQCHHGGQTGAFCDFCREPRR